MIDLIGDILRLGIIALIGVGIFFGIVINRKEALQTIGFFAVLLLAGLILFALGTAFPYFYLLLGSALGLVILVKVGRKIPAFLRAAFADGPERGWERLLAVVGTLAILAFIGWISSLNLFNN